MTGLRDRQNLESPSNRSCLVVMEACGRAAICDYAVTHDCLCDITPRELTQLRQTAWERTQDGEWSHTPRIRHWDVGDKRYHGTWGIHKKVVSMLRGMLDDKGFIKMDFYTPSAEPDSLNLYVVGVQRIR